MRSEDRPREKLKHRVSVLYIRNSRMDYGVKDWMKHWCMINYA